MVGNYSDDGDTATVKNQPPQAFSSIYHVLIEQLGRFRFVSPISFEVSRESEGLVLANDEANLYGAGMSVEEAIVDLESEIEFAWRHYVVVEDTSKFHKSAIKYRHWLLENVEVLQ
jgi:hypothetical protein